MKFQPLPESHEIIQGITCRLYSSVGSCQWILCQVLKDIKFNLDLGIVFGYLKIDEFNTLHYLSAHATHYETEGMASLSTIQHVYAGSKEVATKVLVIGDKTIYNVAINRYRDSDTIISFIGQMKIKDVEKLKYEIGGIDGSIPRLPKGSI